MTSTILLLIGTSSAGKSTLAKQLQAILPDHYLLFGLDDVFRMVSPRWGGGLAGPFSYHGFRCNITKEPIRQILTTHSTSSMGGSLPMQFHWSLSYAPLLMQRRSKKLRKPTHKLKGTVPSDA
jgi:energy-coupling factor transporter ATP-binding protein EcfA2